MSKKGFIYAILKDNLKTLQMSIEKGTFPRTERTVWPSEASVTLGPVSEGECKRALYYRYTGTPPSNPMSLIGRSICDTGKLIEVDQILKYKGMGMFYSDQESIKYDIPGSEKKPIHHSGKIDTLIKFKDQIHGIEIKTIGTYKIDSIFGTDTKLGLPSPSNIMQAILYKYYFSKVEKGKNVQVNDVYLLYIDRGTGRSKYFKIDIDNDGYPIITPIDGAGNEKTPIRTIDYPSYNDFLEGKEKSTDELGRIAGVRICTQDIFDKYISVFNQVDNKTLPSKDYNLKYTQEEIDKELLLGRITARKHKMAKNGTKVYGDVRCQGCAYQKLCLEAEGIIFQKPEEVINLHEVENI